MKQITGIIDTPHKFRPKLSYDKQIDYLKAKGVKFEITSESEAKDFLKYNNYFFKIKAYGKIYTDLNPVNSTYKKYQNLDFAYLKELSTIDMHLREFILKMALDIEHYLKLNLLRAIVNNDDVDGYKIVEDYFSKCKPNLKNEIIEKSSNSYCKDLIEHRSGSFAVWDFVEVISFGDFVDFYNYYFSLYPSKNNMKNNLKSVQWLRNAAAHNNCIINQLSKEFPEINSVNREVSSYIASNIKTISNNTKNKKMSTRPVHDFTVMIYVFCNIVTSENIKRITMNSLKDLFEDRLVYHKDYFESNMLIQSNYKFMKKIVDYFCDLCNNM